MALRIRLRKQGRTNRPFFRMVVTDCRNPRDGQYVEALGWYDPLESDNEKNLNIHTDRIQHWLNQGALLTESAEALVSRAAPHVIKGLREKELAQRLALATKRRARKKAAKDKVAK
jgi:small subunit ribosomal protein S16